MSVPRGRLGSRWLHLRLRGYLLDEALSLGADDIGDLLGGIGTPPLADRRPVAVEGALAEAEMALLVLELVARQSQLGVLDAHVGAAVVHLVLVHDVVIVQVGELGEEFVEGQGVGAAVAQRPGEHGDGPFAQAEGLVAGTLLVEIADKVEADVPVAAQVEVLDAVHGDILQLWQADDGGKEVQLDQVPVKGAAAAKDGVVVGGGDGCGGHGGDHVLEDGTERVTLVEP